MERRNNRKVYLCEDTLEGIFSAIYVAWNEKNGHKNNQIRIKQEEKYYNLEFFTEYVEVESCQQYVEKVSNSIKSKISVEAYEWVCKCSSSNHLEKADYIYHFLVLGFAYGKEVLNCVHHPYVLPMLKMNVEIGREIEHYYGFVRFTQLENTILFSKIAPKNNIIALLAPHFVDRLPNENWIIYDEKRKKAVLHEAGKNYFLANMEDVFLHKLESHAKMIKENEIQQLWKAFVDSINIKERENIKLQQSMLPKKFRKYMIEF